MNRVMGQRPTPSYLANGQYVVFQTKATNFFENDGGVAGPHGVEPDVEPPGTLREGGIFRYDILTGEIQLVADGSEIHTEGPEKGKLIFRGAQNPSVSADGRYVVFSTAQQLVSQDNNENIDVYVRDMDVPLTANRKDSGAYTLVSAKNGGEEPATYTPRDAADRRRRTRRRCMAEHGHLSQRPLRRIPHNRIDVRPARPGIGGNTEGTAIRA